MRKLLLALFAVSFVAIVGLSFSLIASAERSDALLMSRIETRLLEILEERGVSGLSMQMDQINQAIVPGPDQIEIAVWRKTGGGLKLQRESRTGVADHLSGTSGEIRIDGKRFKKKLVDVAEVSKAWALPMGDIAVSFAVAQPSRERQSVSRTIWAVILAYGIGIAVTGCFFVTYWRRYRRSIVEINGVLNSYSDGETGVLIERPLPTPELRTLGAELNKVLPQIDQIFEDLRHMSSHIAHELRTPLQLILAGVSTLSQTQEPNRRDELKQDLVARINDADARVDAVLELFRLQSEAEITFDENVPLGEDFADLVQDMKPYWAAEGGTIDQDIDESIAITCNSGLMNVLIDNLLTNARKYASPATVIRTRLRARGEVFELIVQNEGSLPPGFGDDAFKRYARGSGVEGRSGVGLGLSLVKAIADKHGHTLRLDQTEGGRVRVSVCGFLKLRSHD